MASNYYDKHLPDYGDLDNRTGNCPGFRLGVRENDGGIGIDMGPVADSVDADSYHRAFLNVPEAQELAAALQKAINCARSKSPGSVAHPSRARDI